MKFKPKRHAYTRNDLFDTLRGVLVAIASASNGNDNPTYINGVTKAADSVVTALGIDPRTGRMNPLRDGAPVRGAYLRGDVRGIIQSIHNASAAVGSTPDYMRGLTDTLRNLATACGLSDETDLPQYPAEEPCHQHPELAYRLAPQSPAESQKLISWLKRYGLNAQIEQVNDKGKLATKVVFTDVSPARREWAENRLQAWIENDR